MPTIRFCFILLSTFLLSPLFSQAPLPCGPGAGAADDCSTACISCDLNNFQGSLTGFTAGSAPGFCGVFNNDAWLGFSAGATNMTLTIIPSNCANGDGLTAAVYASCAATPLVCATGAVGGGSTPITLTYNGYNPGMTYYLVIDGYSNDECDFMVLANPAIGVQAPPVGATGPISGPASACPGATVTYSLAPISGAGFYTWTAPPGATINGQPSPLTLAAPDGQSVSITFGSQGGQVCVKPGNVCDDGTMICRNVTVAPIPPTVLPPVTICHSDLPWMLPWGQSVQQSGIYQTVFESYLGCDSVVRQQIIVKPPLITQLGLRYICPGSSCFTVCGEDYCQPGNYTHICESYQGCDSIINFSLLSLQGTNMGLVFMDLNGNGVRDGNEPAVSGATIATSSGQTTTSSAQGLYQLQNLSAGDTIYVVPPSNASGAEPPFHIYNPAQPSCNDFALIPAPTAWGYVFLDLNQNGLFDGNDETVSGALITTSGGLSALSNANGYYILFNVTTGDTVSIVLPAAAGSSAPPYHLYPANGSGPYNFALQANAGVATGVVYYDQNQNNNYNPGEQLAEGVIVYSSGGSITATVGGFYLLSGLNAGDTIRVELPGDSLGTSPLYYLYDPGQSTGYSFAIQLPQGAATGRIFWDLDGNGTYSTGDFLINGAVVRTSGGQLASTLNGFFNFAVVPDGDTLQVTGAFASFPVSPAFRLYQYGQINGYDFALSPPDDLYDLGITIGINGVFRPGFNTVLGLTITNHLPFPVAGVTVKTVLPAFIDFNGTTSPLPLAQNGDTLCWTVGAMAPLQTVLISFTVNTAIGTPLGTSVDIPAWVLPVIDDLAPANNEYTLHRTVVNAYDPNDKLVEPAQLTENFLSSGEPLTYTVRFQNTGNYPADFVRIIDTLQSGLDPASFRLLGASHPVTWQFTAPRVVEFHFAEIYLPDSSSNEPGSHGFVAFTLAPVPGLVPGDAVGNFADIYFDYNEPIRTNTATSQYVLFTEPAPNSPELSVRPNPAAYQVRCSWPDALPGPGRLWLVNLQGVPVLDLDVPYGATNAAFNVSYVPDGLYIVLLQGGAQPLHKRLVVNRAGPVRRD